MSTSDAGEGAQPSRTPQSVIYANCFGAPAGDVLVTDEVAVARAAAAGTRIVTPDALIDPEHANELNAKLWHLSFFWTTATGAADPSSIAGISAADIAGGEALHRFLMPAGRGLLEAEAFLAAGHAVPEHLTVVTPADASRHRASEVVQSAAFAATLRARSGATITVDQRTADDARDQLLIDKYRLSRGAEVLPRPDGPARRQVAAASTAINTAATLLGRNRRPRVLVHEYNPTAVFARRRSPDLPLVRLAYPGSEIGRMVRSGDRALALPAAASDARHEGVRAALLASGPALRAEFSIDGVDLWPLLADDLCDLVAEYAAWMVDAVPVARRALRRGNVRSVLVPFDTPPVARLLVRVAQAADVPTFVLNDGWKGDGFSTQGMATDTPLASSDGIRRRYFARHPHAERAVLTGDPRTDEATEPARVVPHPESPLRHILVGSFTFSPVDLNCRRSDAERFLADTLQAIRESTVAQGARVTLKLHPADRVGLYEDVLRRHADVQVDVVGTGNVVDLFADADLYLTTYSTSLLQAAAAGVPFLYYAVNHQRLHPPFHPDDPVMGPRTARTADDLRRLLDAPATRLLPGDDLLSAWLDDTVGAHDGRATERVEAAVRGPLDAAMMRR